MPDAGHRSGNPMAGTAHNSLPATLCTATVDNTLDNSTASPENRDAITLFTECTRSKQSACDALLKINDPVQYVARRHVKRNAFCDTRHPDQRIRNIPMDTALIKGAAVPEFDRQLHAWLQKERPRNADDQSAIVTIGIRNQDHHIYRYIRACGTNQHLDTVAFLDQAGFSALPVEFAKETGLDYVFQHAGW
jgi:hypothetical protein